jgi:hypothetical protein
LEVLARHLVQVAVRQPVAVALVGVIHPVEVVRHPPGVGLSAHHLQLGVTLEHRPEDERAHHVLAAAHDREETVDARAADLAGRAGEDVEREREAEAGRRLVELVVDERVVVLDTGNARHHHAMQAGVGDGVQVAHAILGRAHRGLADAEEPVGERRAVLRDPAVVRLHAGVLVVEVLVVAEHHAHGGVEDLADDAIAVLVCGSLRRVPPAAVQLVEGDAHHRDLLGRLPRGGHEAHGHGLALEAGDHEDVTGGVVPVHVGRSIAEGRIDAVDVGVGRLGDVRVGRDARDLVRHDPRS